MLRGTITEYNPERGYGLLTDSETNQVINIYANYVHLEEGETLLSGQKVTYEMDNDRQRNCAFNVRLVRKPTLE